MNIFMMPGDVLLMGRGVSGPQGSFILRARCWGSSKCAACKQHENCSESACCSGDTGQSNLHFLEKALRSGQVCSLSSPTKTTTKKLLRLYSLLHFHAFSYSSTRNRDIFIFALESLQNILWWVFLNCYAHSVPKGTSHLTPCPLIPVTCIYVPRHEKGCWERQTLLPASDLPALLPCIFEKLLCPLQPDSS